MVIFNFIRDPEVGIFARAKRLSKEAKEKASKDEKKVEARDEISENDKSG
jgi:sphingolipid delta-4 desaturase